MNRIKISTHVFLCFLMMMFLMVTFGCSKSDDTPAPPTYSISGAVSGTATSGVLITLTNVATAATSSQTTAAGGTYSFTGLANGTYTLAPVLSGKVFDPSTTVVIVNGSNMVQNFTASNSGGTTYTVSGTVVVGATPLSGVKVTLSGTSGASLITGTEGIWTFTVAAGGTYNVTAYRSGYAITPPEYNWVSIAASHTGNVFTATVAKFSQADLQGTWNYQSLETGSWNGWARGTVTIDYNGNVTFDSCVNRDGTCTPASVVLTINETTGVIADSGNADNHYTMASNKTFIVGTQHSIGTTHPTLIIFQKNVPGTSYEAGDVQGKNFVFHQFNVGSSQKWQYGTGSTSSTGAINISSETEPSGTSTPGDVGATISVDSNGIVSMSDNATWKGFLSADHRTIVGTDTESGGTEFHMLIIQLTNGQASSTSQVVGTSVEHMLATGASPAPFWAHQTITIASGGVMSFSNWVDSNGGTTASTDTPTISISGSGTATVTLGSVTPDFHGQLSYDGSFMVGTQTFDTGVYSLSIITH